MGEQENRQILQDFWKLVQDQNWEAANELVHDEYVQEWPQSGERIRGKQNAMEINKNYPGFPKMTERRTLVCGDLAVQEVTLDYDGKTYDGVSIYEFKDGQLWKETDYFAEPFEAPAWRSQWVEKI
jgi:hypothetical protein